jgi:hypothetical protein
MTFSIRLYATENSVQSNEYLTATKTAKAKILLSKDDVLV